ncbi:MAG: glycoside hydrolase family 88 protein [Proteiniphilum sp.]|jgi:hypothetical protein|nr:glycoside hydrolase family 88 protein [Proteiniphilum sp.]
MKTLTVSFFLITTLLLQSCGTEKTRDTVAENFDFAARQLLYAVELTEQITGNGTDDSQPETGRKPLSPRTAGEDGSLILVPAYDWTSGFFPGELWFMYEYTGDPHWEELAVRFTSPLEGQKLNRGTHDLGFMIYNSFGNGFRLSKRANYREVILEAARSLASRYKPEAKVIRSWDYTRNTWQCPVIIDNMMNLELLFKAFSESSDSTFYHIAVNHANTTMKNHFREDYSTWHVIDYDTITGEIRHRNTHQGYADGSTWSRGEAWALYGYTMTYRETGDETFLMQARNIAEFIFTHPRLPEDLIPYWDYDAPGIPDEPRDVSAAAITASALYELSQYGGEKAAEYRSRADTIIENLTDNYRAALHSGAGFLLLHSTGAKSLNSEIDVPLVYADYYFLEALLRKKNLGG